MFLYLLDLFCSDPLCPSARKLLVYLDQSLDIERCNTVDVSEFCMESLSKSHKNVGTSLSVVDSAEDKVICLGNSHSLFFLLLHYNVAPLMCASVKTILAVAIAVPVLKQ